MMRASFRGNPNTNKAGRLSAINAKRREEGLRPLTWQEFYGEAPGELDDTDPKPDPKPAPKQGRLF